MIRLLSSLIGWVLTLAALLLTAAFILGSAAGLFIGGCTLANRAVVPRAEQAEPR